MAMGKVQTEESGSLPGLIVVTVSGEVDLAVAPAMDSHLSAALGQGQDIVVDLTDATFLDSVALGVLTWSLEAKPGASFPDHQRPTRAPGLRTDRSDREFRNLRHTAADLMKRLSQADSKT